MKLLFAACLPLLSIGALAAQERSPQPRSVTVPATIDQNRVIIAVDLRLPDGSPKSMRAWVDNGNPDLSISRRVATLLGLSVTCGEHECSSPAPREISIGGMTVPLTAVKEAKIPLRPVNAAAVLAVGLNAEINIPSTILRGYDVLIDFPERKFSIGLPGTIRFRGSFDKLAAAHPPWPHMTGAVGSANNWGTEEETKWQLMRLDRLQYGPLFLTDVPVVSLPEPALDSLRRRAGMTTIGLLGSNVLLNYRVGLDYSHSMVYFEVGRTFDFPEFDVVGLVLRPEEDGGFTVIAVADVDGKPSLPVGSDGIQPGDHLEAVNDIAVRGSTMGQVWSMLRGTPGQEKRLTIERGGKQLNVIARVRHFLPKNQEDENNKGLARPL